MSSYKGSSWFKWDLHVHTPDSLVSGYGGQFQLRTSQLHH